MSYTNKKINTNPTKTKLKEMAQVKSRKEKKDRSP